MKIQEFHGFSPLDRIGQHWRLALIALIFLGAALLGKSTGLLTAAGDWPQAILAGREQVPLWAFMLAFVVLPALGFPILAFYATVSVFTDGLDQALLIAWTCMAANMALSYVVARTFAQPLRRLAERRGYRIPSIERADDWKVVIMMRASPLPWLMQSCLLTLGGARFMPYMVFGLPVQAMVGLGVIVLGESVLSGNAKWALAGVFLIMVAYVTLSIIRRRARTSSRSDFPAAGRRSRPVE